MPFDPTTRPLTAAEARVLATNLLGEAVEPEDAATGAALKN